MAKENFRYNCLKCECEFDCPAETNKCYWCNSIDSIELVDYTDPNVIYEPDLILDLTPKTLGSYAEKNSRRVSKDKILEESLKKEQKKADLIEEKFGTRPIKKTKKKPFWRTDDKPLDLGKIKDVNKYIRTGQKS